MYKAWSHVHRTVVVCLLIAIGPAFAAPPVVVKATPDHGDTDVNPDLQEIRIEFDQDMSQGGHSVCGGGPNYPKVSGKPKWEGTRVFILPVALEPNHDYSFMINCPAAGNFKNANGESAEVYPITFKTGAKRSGEESVDDIAAHLTVEQNRAAVDELRKAIEERYSYKDLHKLNWDDLFKKHRDGLEKSQTRAAFARGVAGMLAAAKDIHISVWVSEAAFPSFQRKIEPNINVEALSSIVPQWNQANECVTTGRFEDGVGYILLPTWSRDCRESMEAAYRFVGDLGGENAPGLIIDVRPNSGGDEVLAREFAGCFVSRKKVYSKNTIRDIRSPGGFAGPYDRIVEPNTARPAFQGKVAVLMGPANMSSCESFLLMMKEARNSKLFGERSYGSSGNPKPADLGNGVTVQLPSWQDMQPDGTLLEGAGIVPDVKVEAPSGAFKSNDPVLKAALEWIRQK